MWVNLQYNGESQVIKAIIEALNHYRGEEKHVIIDSEDTSMPNREGLKFEGATVTDDSTNNQTVIQIPTLLSEFTNDVGFITNTANNLVNYYLKSETYTQAEVNALISSVVSLNIEVVQALPTTDISTTTIYLLPKQTAGTQDVYDEYINTDGTTSGWEKIGSTEIDLTNYYTKTETNTLLADKVDKVTGKQLSTEDFTSALKSKLEGIEAGANVNVQADWNESDNTSDAYIQNKPTIPDAQVQSDWNQTDPTAVDYIKNKPPAPSGQVQSDWNQTNTSAVDYIKNKPTIPSATSDLLNDSNFVSDSTYVHTDNNFTQTLKSKLDGVEDGAEVNVQADWNEADNTADEYIKNKPSIPSATSDLTNDSNFVSDANYTHTDNNYTATEKNKLSGIEAGAQANVQADWNQTDNTADDYIKNKPTIPSGGDSVTWTQIQQGGQKIAEIDINGNTQDVYAPQGGGGSYTEGDGINITNDEISVDTAFTEASTRANIASGDTLSTIWGKIKKFFSDLKTHAFTALDLGSLDIGGMAGGQQYVYVKGVNDFSYNNGVIQISKRTGYSSYDTELIPIPTGDEYVAKTGDTMSGVLYIDRANGTASSTGGSQIYLGNATPRGTVGNSRGVIYLYGRGQYWGRFYDENGLTADRSYYLPDKSGTIALTNDIGKKIQFSDAVVSKNGSVTINISDFQKGRCYLIMISSDNAYEWHWFGYYLSANQLPQLVRLDSGGSLSVSVSGGTITISNSNSTYGAPIGMTIL